jgi:hypothetical protein
MMGGIINGRPTKTFFVNMITRDITIRDAILDLLDNSIDGASRINKDDYSGLFIKITVNNNEFILEDNCGGFSLDIAKNYAFRFGRPESAQAIGGTVGRFGVGMKRSLFKMGKSFEVESKTEIDHYQVDIDVANWLIKTDFITNKKGDKEEIDDWNFDYVGITPEISNLDKEGTYIKVSGLYGEVSSQFRDDAFLVSLEDDIEKLLNFSLEKGIKIYLNGKLLKKKDIEIFNENTTPYNHEFEKGDVKYKIVAGLGSTGVPSSAGWYIYCNDRLVLSANKNEITGWGIDSVPKFNNDYAMFRGVVYLDSEDTIKLPLTTTKKGVDSSSDVYRLALTYMKEAMQNVISFLKEVRRLEDPNEYRKTVGDQQNKTINVVSLKSTTFEEIRKFISPPISYEELTIKPTEVRISFSVDRKLGELVKEYNGSKNFKELGLNVFNYYCEMEEILENE